MITPVWLVRSLNHHSLKRPLEIRLLLFAALVWACFSPVLLVLLQFSVARAPISSRSRPCEGVNKINTYAHVLLPHHSAATVFLHFPHAEWYARNSSLYLCMHEVSRLTFTFFCICCTSNTTTQIYTQLVTLQVLDLFDKCQYRQARPSLPLSLRLREQSESTQ